MSFGTLGWIEFFDRSSGDESEFVWRAVVDVTSLLPQNDSTSCSCLFGIRNYSGWKPVVETRGLPADASEVVRCQATDENYFFYSATWLTWSDILAIPWQESVVDHFVHRYRQNAEGELIRIGGFVPNDRDRYQEADVWTDSDDCGICICKVERITRREAAWAAFSRAFALMRFFARIHGNDGVRLVIWFGE